MDSKLEKLVEIRAYPNWFFAWWYCGIDTDNMLMTPKNYHLEAVRFAYTVAELREKIVELNQKNYSYSYAMVETGKRTKYTRQFDVARKFLE